MGALTRIRFSDSLIELSDSLIRVSGRPTGETAEPEGTALPPPRPRSLVRQSLDSGPASL
jgi:hypothetical protein